MSLRRLSLPRRLPAFDFGAEDVGPRGQMRWALGGLAVFAVIAGIVLALYLRPPGTSSYHLELPESGGLVAGDDVRIAGVPVGSVRSMTLADHHVDVTFTVRSRYRLGDLTSVSIRMLTPIGGFYLAVHPEGSKPLTGSIPAERATLPFLLGNLYEKSDAVVTRLDPNALRTALDKAAAVLTESPGAVRSTVEDLESVATVLSKQKTQIENLLALSDEYLRTADDNKDLAVEIIRGYAMLGPQIVAARNDLQVFADGVANLSGLLFDFLGGPYAEKVEPLLPPLEQAGDRGAELLKSVDSMMSSMTATLTGLAKIAGPDGQALIDRSGLTTPRLDVCLPVPGKQC
ncbi:MlaD family protein [Nocardia nova]|jgi:phospholipid/cholesterol/gamma-HCH transport system substrate-binding protein|uniref:MCE family protein n=1 Tax=Nocardia nova TaxID=37330 RepID=A0A2S5ZXF1_9NOCA|nr:MlaD family protein [Nocardia nova]PPI99625.1 MCE family protein [Nocardia nova]PPJ22668.1 MCE family protein [Nocardia nova]